MALVEGVKYGLSTAENYHYNNNKAGLSSSSSSSSECSGRSGVVTGGAGAGGVNKKSVVFVKLTDSALKAIEDFLQQQHSQKTGDRATLQFLGNEGRIHVPSSNPNANNGHSFDFSLSSNADIEGPQGSFECIQQTGSSSLQSMGTLPFKIRIHAKDDVYEATKQRIEILEQNRQHECAKEIKPNNADIGRKVKTKMNFRPSPSNFSSHKKSSLLSSSNNNNVHHSSTNLTNHNRINNGYYTNHNHSNNSNANSHQPGHHHLQLPHHNPLANNDTNNQIKHNYITTSGNAPPKMTGNMIGGGDITRKPLRDRIIHLLAVKPYKKPELLNRLQKEGLKQKDKHLVMTVLLQVSNMKGNEYFLNRGIWNDVQEFWPFYTEEERQVMKRRKPQNLTPPGSDCSIGSGTSGSSLSPPSSSTSGHSGSSPPSSFSTTHYGPSSLNGMLPFNNNASSGSNSNAGAKRTTPDSIDSGDDSISSKRQRISHFVRDDLISSNSNKKDEIEDQQVIVNVNNAIVKPGPVVVVDKLLECNSFLNKYPTIRTGEQRTQYKTDFNNEYEHYRDLHSVIDKVGKRFAQLQEMLNQEEEGTDAYVGVKDQIVTEYHHNKRSRKYQEARRAFSNLHEKLSHIKRLVHDYDTAHSTSSSSSSSSTNNNHHHQQSSATSSSGYGSYEDYHSV